MKLNNTLIAMGMAFAVVSTASFAAGTVPPVTAGSSTGKIMLEGTLVNAACALKDASGVNVNFDEITVHSLNKGGTSRTKSIELVDCDTTVASHATVTYNPVSQIDGTLAAMNQGTAKGLAIKLADSSGQPVSWGQPTQQVNLSNGDSTIPFTATVVKSDVADVEPGTFKSQINFQIDYQ